ncbi:MAG: ribosome maturation factor RimP [Clostridia bacterium]
MSRVCELVKECVEPIITANDMVLVDIEYKKQYDSMNLTIYIDKVGGVTLNDCELIHKAIDAPLDELNPTNDSPYVLNVSSSGLDRPLKNEYDFKKNLNCKVEVSLYEPLDKCRKFIGVLTEYNLTEGIFLLQTEDKIFNFELKKVALIKPYIEF